MEYVAQPNLGTWQECGEETQAGIPIGGMDSLYYLRFIMFFWSYVCDMGYSYLSLYQKF